MEGTITLVQESRFQMTDDQGASHLFLLGPNAGAEPAQLVPLAKQQARLRVEYTSGDNVIALMAKAIHVLETEQGR